MRMSRWIRRWGEWLVMRLQTLQLDVVRHSGVSRRQPSSLRCLPWPVGVGEPWRATAGCGCWPSAGARHTDVGQFSRTASTRMRLRRRLPSASRTSQQPRLHSHSSQRYRSVCTRSHMYRANITCNGYKNVSYNRLHLRKRDPFAGILVRSVLYLAVLGAN